MGIFGSLVGWIATPFTAAAGWAWETVVGGLSDWIMKGVLSLLMAMWNFMDTASSPRLKSDWFYWSESSPFRIALGIGIAMSGLLVLLAITRAVAAGSPGAVLKSVGHDLPLAALSMLMLVTITAAAVDVADALSDYIWQQTRDDAEDAMAALGDVMIAASGNWFFVGPLIGIVMIIAMLFMWVVLFVRESLIYLVVIYAVAFGLPSMIFPPLRDTSKKVLELLVALVIAKPVMILAISVGVSALGGIGATGEPGEGVGDNAAAELGTLIVGVVTFGMAAFMPFLLFKLMPVVAAAVVAQGVASGPMRAGQQGMQMQYYGSSTMRRLGGSNGGSASKSGAGAAGQPGGAGPGGPSGAAGGAGPAGGSGAGLAGGGGGAAAGSAGGAASTAAAAPAAGPLAPVVVAAAAAKAGADAVKSTAKQSAGSLSTQSGGSTPSLDLKGGQ